MGCAYLPAVPYVQHHIYLSYKTGKYWTINGLGLRHLAKSEEDVGYKWHMHNGRDFGLQSLNDTKGDVHINTTWIKFNADNKYGTK